MNIRYKVSRTNPLRQMDIDEEPSKKCRGRKQKGVEKSHWCSQGWNQAVAPIEYYSHKIHNHH
jgi:hypothetical protein